MEKITGRENRRLVNARKVRDGKVAGRIFVEGKRLAGEALRSGMVIEECFVTEGFRDAELIELVAERTHALAELPDKLFRSIADTDQPQGIILIAKRPETSAAAIERNLASAEMPTVVFLKEINNPSNLGAILRTAEAAGACGVVISKNSADVFSPKAVRAAMGSAFRVATWDDVDFVEVLDWARSRGLRTIAADISSGKSYTEINWELPSLVIFGSEAHGLSDAELEMITETVSIPMANGVESLNLAVSAGIILFEAKR